MWVRVSNRAPGTKHDNELRERVDFGWVTFCLVFASYTSVVTLANPRAEA